MKKGMAKWICTALILAILANVLFLGTGLRPGEEAEPLPHRTAEISAESAPSGQGSTGEELPETTEPSEEPTEPSTQSTEPTEPSEETTEPEEPSTETRSPATEPSDPTREPEGDNREPSSTEETEPGGENGDESGGGDGPEDEDRLHIVTDLTDCVLTFDQLEEDRFPFYAYIVNGERDMFLRVKLRNSQTSANGKFLTAAGRNYEAKLARQENNFFTLYIKQGSRTVLEQTYVVRYVNRRADEDSPSVGEHPPTVSTNLDGMTEELTNRNFTLLVTARTYRGKVIHADHILVTQDGKTVRNPTGNSTLEYELYFDNPAEGDRETHRVTVLAWDDEGNSTFLSYTVTYAFVDAGGVTGTAYIMLDATVVGLDPATLGGTFAYEIKQDEPASYAVLAMLEDFGYEADCGGTPDDGFYLRRIYRGGMMDYGGVPDALWSKILEDGIGLTGQTFSDSLGEFDYTQGAGWMYSVNGVLYAGKGLSNYYLNDGDTLYIRFTLAYGKDIGGYNAGGGSYGKLPTYCGAWVGGGYYESHAWGEEFLLREAACQEAGAMAHTCTVCGEERQTAELPPLGHSYEETARQEPSEEAPGWIEYTCTRCGEAYREEIFSEEAVRRKKREEILGQMALGAPAGLRDYLAGAGRGRPGAGIPFGHRGAPDL